MSGNTEVRHFETLSGIGSPGSAVPEVYFGHGLTRQLRERLEQQRIPVIAAPIYPDTLADLPPPVLRYFHAVLTPGHTGIGAVCLTHQGTFNLSDSGEKWTPFTSTQRVILNAPGFDWEGKIQIAPGISVTVHDAFIAGEGILSAKVVGLIPIAEERGKPELAKGELMRFLAEAAWYPTRLLPGNGLSWRGIDDRAAEANLTDHGISVSLTFDFDAEGLITTVRAAERGRLVKGVSVPTPWVGRFGNYAWHDGMRIPVDGEVAWELPDGLHTYWRGHLTDITYEFT